ncbi:MAG: hypothetical protein K5773_02975 [Pseudobutyrivibrio sp.]|nr:hypothetical protein [Pseudobutyrivibrio sp.]
MPDEAKLKQELLYMVKLTEKYDFTNRQVVDGILRLENERQILTSVFGKRFKDRIFDIAYDNASNNTCVICGQEAENGVICQDCLNRISHSAYASAKAGETEHDIQTEVKTKKKIHFLSYFKYVLLVSLALICFAQIWLLYTFHTLPDHNPTQEPYISDKEIVAVSDEESALAQLQLDYSPDDGYDIISLGPVVELSGLFANEVGASATEIEENLSDEERYDYFLIEEAYKFYISYNDGVSIKLGLAEVSTQGNIIVKGDFNDLRDPNAFYRIR